MAVGAALSLGAFLAGSFEVAGSAAGASLISMPKIAPRSAGLERGGAPFGLGRGNGDRLFDQFLVIHAPELEEQLGR